MSDLEGSRHIPFRGKMSRINTFSGSKILVKFRSHDHELQSVCLYMYFRQDVINCSLALSADALHAGSEQVSGSNGSTGISH